MIVALVMSGDMVRRAATQGEKADALARAALTIAEIPQNMALILSGRARPEDFVTRIRAVGPVWARYRPLDLPDPRPDFVLPVGWTSGATGRQPVALMFRLTESGEEDLLIADDRRQIVRRFRITAPRLSGQYAALEGNATPTMLDDGTVIVFPLGADGLYRKDLCGRVIWATPGM